MKLFSSSEIFSNALHAVVVFPFAVVCAVIVMRVAALVV